MISSLQEIIQNQAAEIGHLKEAAQRGPTVQDSPETVTLVSSLQDTVQQQRKELGVLRSEVEQRIRQFNEEVREFMCKFGENFVL